MCQTAVLIGVSYALMSYFEPNAMNKLYLARVNDDFGVNQRRRHLTRMCVCVLVGGMAAVTKLRRSV